MRIAQRTAVSTCGVSPGVEYEEVDSEQLSDLPEADRHPRQVPAEYTEISLDVGSLLILDPML